MGLDSIFSIIPTIGNVVGGLLEGLFTTENDVPLRKYTFRVGSELADEIDVVNENGQLSLRNRTANTVCVSFPAQNGNEGETIIVPSCNSVPLNDRFKECAANDVDSFNITAASDSVSQNALFAGENVLTISAGGTVKVGDSSPKFIGVYTSVLLSETDITIRQIDGKGKGEVVSLYLQSTGGSGSFNAHDAEMDGNSSVTIPHTLILKAGEEVHVSTTINYVTSNLSEYMERNSKKYSVRQMGKDEIKMLANIRPINRRAQ